jgi:GntR family transcriptional regulator
MFVNEGAQVELLKAERQRFLKIEWPKVLATIERLNLDANDLLLSSRSDSDSKESGEGE